MPENPYEPPKVVSIPGRPRRRKWLLATLATIATRTLIGLFCGLAIGVACMILLPQRSADGRTVYNWIFVAMLIVIAGVVIGAISGIRRAWLSGTSGHGPN
jgi:hypothetical protein